MLWFIAISFVSLFAVSRFFRRFANPYKLDYVFGLKGAGKSTFMVKNMLRDLKNGWHVYTNMADVAIDGVRFFDVNELITKAPPPKSSIYIDEAGLVWDNRGFKSFDSGFTAFFKLQRKYKCKVTINSQSFDVDKKIRDLVDHMYLMTNIGNVIGVARPIKRTIKLLEAQGNSEARIADNLRFASLTQFKLFWMPNYWKYFNSFEAPKRNSVLFKNLYYKPKKARLTPRVQLKLLQYELRRRRPPH